MDEQGKKLRLMMLLQGLNVGGLEKVAVDLANHLPETYEITLCCYDNLGPLESLLKENREALLLERKPGFDPGIIVKLRRELKNRKIDVIHAHNHTAFFYGTMAARMGGTKKIVYTEHGRTEPLSWKARLAHRVLSRFVHQTIVVADYLKDVLIREEGFPKDKIRFIPNGIDDSPYLEGDRSDTLRDELGLDRSTKLVGVIARLDPIKNHKLVLRAMKAVIAEEPSTRLLLVGDGPLKEELSQIVQKDPAIQDAVLFLGERNDVPNILKNLDMFVLPSLSEGMSLTLVEAMAASLPIVVTEVGGNPAIITHKVSGILVPSDDHESMAKAVLDLLRDDDLSSRLAEGARKRFEEEYTIGQMVKRYRQVYES
ncbi:MAG: glycosyltransferase [Planctomycetota bacterium]|jgi:glycosyltransferase involved in cell wall biosynthesis